jgi:hypothetical protein
MFRDVSESGRGSTGFRMFQLFTNCSRVEDPQRRPYRQNRRVVEHKGLLRVCGLFRSKFPTSPRLRWARLRCIRARSCTPLSRARLVVAYGL